MIIEYRTGNATSPIGNGAKIIVHVCNDIGAWGRGFVLAISERWPDPERRYRAWHRGEETQPFTLGEVQFVQVAEDIWVANLIGQRGIRALTGVPPIRYEAIQKGLGKVALEAKRLSASVHMPRIGCSLAGGKWESVERIVDERLVKPGVPVTVYDPPT
jgi:O-acetyl-ADP-ribose deacetylase (regulator of RNase III)